MGRGVAGIEMRKENKGERLPGSWFPGWAGLGQERSLPQPGRGLGTDLMGPGRSPTMSLSPSAMLFSPLKRSSSLLIVQSQTGSRAGLSRSQAPERGERVQPGWLQGPRRGSGEATVCVSQAGTLHSIGSSAT